MKQYHRHSKIITKLILITRTRKNYCCTRYTTPKSWLFNGSENVNNL